MGGQNYLGSLAINHITFQRIQYFMNNCVETKERRAFVLLRQLRGVCDVAVTLHSGEFALLLMCLPGLDKRRLSLPSRRRTSISTIRASLESSEASAFVFSAKSERAKRVSAVPNMWDTQTLSSSLFSSLLQSGPTAWTLDQSYAEVFLDQLLLHFLAPAWLIQTLSTEWWALCSDKGATFGNFFMPQFSHLKNRIIKVTPFNGGCNE